MQSRTSVALEEDHFALLGLEPRAAVDSDQLERAYLRKSCETHPDRQGSRGNSDAALTRQAAINEAYRVLRDPWTRFAYLIEQEQPGALQRTKQLDPAFLLEAMEEYETALEARQDPAGRAAMEARTRDELEVMQARVLALLDAALQDSIQDSETKAAAVLQAATLLHQARYAQRRLEALTAQQHR